MICPRPDPYGHTPDAWDRINAELCKTRDALHREIQRAIAEQRRDWLIGADDAD